MLSPVAFVFEVRQNIGGRSKQHWGNHSSHTAKEERREESRERKGPNRLLSGMPLLLTNSFS